MMNIDFRANEEELQAMQEAFNELGQDAIYMSHYQLASKTEFNSTNWSVFLKDARVSDWLLGEMELVKQSKIRSIMKDIDNSKSVGQAQLLNTLINQTAEKNRDEGPKFIYCYVPLNEEEARATNVRILENDPFLEEEDF